MKQQKRILFVKDLAAKKIDAAGFAIVRELKFFLNHEIKSGLGNLLWEISDNKPALTITNLHINQNSLIFQLTRLTKCNLKIKSSHNNNQ